MLRFLFTFLTLLILNNQTIAQNLFDYTNSIKFIKGLKEEKNFEDAFNEIIRLKSSYPNDTTINILLLSVLNFIETPEKTRLLKQLEEYSGNEDVYNLVTSNYILIDSIQNAKKITKVFNNANQFKEDFKICIFLLEEKYDSAYSIKENTSNNNLKQIVEKSHNYKKKNRKLAISLATLMPGLGKIYLNQYMDGITAFFSTSIYAYLSISSFKSNGADAFFPWLNTAAFGVFYFGNIIGTDAAYDRYENTIKIEVENIVKQEIEKIISTY